MSIFLIDYENVHNEGLKGINTCKSTDLVFIFYTKSGEKLPIDIVKIIKESKAKVEFIKSENGSSNALDFQLSSYLGYLISKYPKENFIVISNDGDYKIVQKFWSSRTEFKTNISLSSNLSLKHTNVVKPDILSTLLDSEFKDIAKDIVDVTEKYKTKELINNELCKKYGNAKTKNINTLINTFIKKKSK